MEHLHDVIITGGGRAVLKDGSCDSSATAYAKKKAKLVITDRNIQKLLDANE